jgi:hypothetical protein
MFNGPISATLIRPYCGQPIPMETLKNYLVLKLQQSIKMKRKDYTTGVLWIFYLAFITIIIVLLAFGCAAPQRINPADFSFKKETINPARSMKPLKINPKKCN